MKDFDQYIYEAWGSNKAKYVYKRQLTELFDKYDKKVEAKKKKEGKPARYSGPFVRTSTVSPEAVLAKYPVQILIDKLGYEPKKIIKQIRTYYKSTDKEVVDESAYGKYMVAELEKGTFTKDDLVDWWKEYEDNVLKNKWCDIKWVLKQVDGSRFWDPWRPKDDSGVKNLIENPAKIITYVRSDAARFYQLSEDERTEIQNFYADPVNQDMLSKAIKAYAKQLEKLRPTNETAAGEIFRDILDGKVYVDGKKYDMEDKITYRTGGDGHTRYQGSNDVESEYSRALLSMINTALKEMYDISMDSSIDWDNIYDEWGDEKVYKKKFTGKGGEKIEEFVEDGGNGFTFEFTDLGSSKDNGETGSVHSSSFWTYYKHDFKLEVKVYGQDKPKYTKEFKSITTASSYYSGGWN